MKSRLSEQHSVGAFRGGATDEVVRSAAPERDALDYLFPRSDDERAFDLQHIFDLFDELVEFHGLSERADPADAERQRRLRASLADALQIMFDESFVFVVESVEHGARRLDFAGIERLDVDESQTRRELTIDSKERGIMRGMRAVDGDSRADQFAENTSVRRVGRPFFSGVEWKRMVRDNTINLVRDRLVRDRFVNGQARCDLLDALSAIAD